MAEMNQRLVDDPRTRMLDGEFFKHVSSVSERWFGKAIASLSRIEKARLIPYIFSHTTNTSIPQLSRTFGLDRSEIATMLKS